MILRGVFKYRNLIDGFILGAMGLALYYFIIPWQIPPSEAWAEMSSPFFPKIAAVPLVFLSSLLISKEIIVLKKGFSYTNIETNASRRGNLIVGILACFGVIFMRYHPEKYVHTLDLN